MKLLRCLIVLAACYAAGANSQTFPDRPVRVVIPQIPGGTSDVLGRIVAQKLTDKWGRTVVIENRPGAGGNIGTDAVAKSAPNGYTWLLTYVGSHAINPTLYKQLPFDPVKDLAAVGTLAMAPFVLVANVDLPAKNMAEFIALARSSPGKLNYGAQHGAVNHLLGQLLNFKAGVQTVWVPYRGAADSLTDTISGRLQFNYGSAGAVAQQIRGGKVRALASTGSRRMESLKDVPTMMESGFPDLTVDSWWGLFVAAGTPPAIVRRINTDVNEVLGMPDVLERFAGVGAEPYPTTPEQFSRIAEDDIRKWRDVVIQSGVKLE